MSWDQRFMGLARHVAGWSKDPSTQVGAVVVDDRHCVRSLGFNGFPRGVEDTAERLAEREVKYRLVVHAEANAILNAPDGCLGCTLFVTGSVCCDCAKMVIQSGIFEVVTPVPEQDPFAARADWAQSLGPALEMFREAQVTVRALKFLG